MSDDDTGRDDAALKAEREAARIRQDAERLASRERAEAERLASRERADAERKASHEEAVRERAGARRRRGRGAVNPAGLHPELGDYSHVVFDGDHTYYISGQVPLTSQGDIAGDGMIGQSHQVMKNLVKALESADLDTDSVVKLTVFLTDPADGATFAEVRRQYFSAPFPASSMVVVASLLNERWKLEVEAIAVDD